MWHDTVEALGDLLVPLAQNHGMEVERHPAAPGEALVVLTHGNDRLYAEPAEFNERQMPAIVWFWAFPSMRRVRLVAGGPEEPWEVESSDGVPFHRHLDHEHFLELIEDLTIAVA